MLVSSSCRFVESAVWPDVIEVGMRSKHLGNTSLSWEFGLFRQSDGALLATGEFVHVIIDREGARRPIPLPAELREPRDRVDGRAAARRRRLTGTLRTTEVPPNPAIARFGGTAVVQAALDPNASAAVRGQIRSSVRWFGVPKRPE